MAKSVDLKVQHAYCEEPCGRARARGCCSCTAGSCLSGTVSRMSADVLHDFTPRQPLSTAMYGHRVKLRVALVLLATAAFAALFTVQCTLGGLLQPTYVATAELPALDPCNNHAEACHHQDPGWRPVQQEADARAAANWTCACTLKHELHPQLMISPSFPCELIVQACFNESSPWQAATFATSDNRRYIDSNSKRNEFCGAYPSPDNATANLEALLSFCSRLRSSRNLQMPVFDAMPSFSAMYEAALAALDRAVQGAEEGVLAAVGVNGRLLPGTGYPRGHEFYSPLTLLQEWLMLLRSVLLRIALSQGPYTAGLLSKGGSSVFTVAHENSSILAWPILSGLRPEVHAAGTYADAVRARLEKDRNMLDAFTLSHSLFYDNSLSYYLYEQPYSVAMPGNFTIDTSPKHDFDWPYQHYLLLTEQCLPASCTKVLPRRKVVIVIEALALAGSLMALLFLILCPLLWHWVIMPLSSTDLLL